MVKINQLYDTIQVRHGLMLVGQTGGGKTSNYRVLQNALNLIVREDQSGKEILVDIINPKSLSLYELYGVSKDITWQEGIAEIVVERAIK